MAGDKDAVDKKSESQATASSTQPLYIQYPVSSSWEFTLTNDDKVQGEVYCTDQVSQMIVLQDQLRDIRMISVAGIRESKQLKEASDDPVAAPSNPVHAKKALEEREKRAVKLAEESFKHINPKVRFFSDCFLMQNACTTWLLSWPEQIIATLYSNWLFFASLSAHFNCRLIFPLSTGFPERASCFRSPPQGVQ